MDILEAGRCWRVFRDHDARYLVLSVLIATCVCGFTLWYEIGVADSDSLIETAVAIGQGISAAVAIAIFILAWWEVIMVIARRINERRDRAMLEKGREEATGEWTAWLKRLREAQKEGREFTEPAPSEKAES